nr:uncharacterized protein LOC105333181 isoform X1 [Crassostrea gigas]
MKLVLVCAILLCSTSVFASAQNIQIQAQPQTVVFLKNDLVIVCSITNPTQLSSVFFIQILKNSSTTFDNVVSVTTGQALPVQWKDTVLQNRASVTGNIDSPRTAQLRLTIDKNSVQCPTDFKMYSCKMSGMSTASNPVTEETSPITIFYIVQPTIIELPRVRILNEIYDTPKRQFPVGTTIQLTCHGEIGNDVSKTIRWCARKDGEFSFTGLVQTPIHSKASPSGCQYTRSSVITYNLTSEDIFTEFLCESGDTGMCGTGTAIQYVNISSTCRHHSYQASAQNIQIQALPQTIIYRETDLVIICSITNPSQLSSVFFIELLKNSSTTFETVVEVSTGQTPLVQWRDTTLQNRASATGNIDSPSNAQLRLTIDKNSVLCHADFKMYKCKMAGFSSTALEVVTQETSSIALYQIVKPTVIETPRVRILNEIYDTPKRHFPAGTTIQLTCQGEVGNDASKTIRWCTQKTNEMMFTELAQTPIHSEASLSGCQYTRSSTITYTLTKEDTFTQFLCESGDTGLCGTGTAIQYVNITIEESGTTKFHTADEKTGTTNTCTADANSSFLVPFFIGIAVGIGVLILAIFIAIILRRHLLQQQMKRTVCQEQNGEEHYTKPVPKEDQPYTELNTYTELHTTNRQLETDQACSTPDHPYTTLNAMQMTQTTSLPR